MPTPNKKQINKDWAQVNEDGYFFPPQPEASDDDDFNFEDICEDIEFSFRENFEKSFLHIH